MPRPEPVVLLHGIYMYGFMLRPLASRLRAAGWQPFICTYASLRRPPAANAIRLLERVRALDAPRVHYIGHSLGGLILRHLLAEHGGRLPPGRCVTLGTPHQGSAVARRLQSQGLGWLLGASREQGLLGGVPDWPADRELGSLAGVARHGLGQLLMELPEPHDGTVSVAETRCPGMRDHIHLACNHTRLLYSAPVVRQITHFLRHGLFDHGSLLAR